MRHAQQGSKQHLRNSLNMKNFLSRYWLPPSRKFLLIVFLLVSASSWKPASAATSDRANPLRVEVGVWFSGIHSINFPDGSYGVEFYLWWVSPDPNFHPFDVFQVLNGREWTTRAVSQRKLKDGTYHTSAIVSATMNHDWKLEYFPFDRQNLRIVIETSLPASELRLVPNVNESKISEFMHVEGFKVTGLSLAERVEKYTTSFGMRDESGKDFSRLIITLGLERESGRLVVAILIGFIVANIIALMTYAIHVSNLAIRASMVGSAIFGAVGNMYFVANELNPAVGSVLVDRFAVGTFTMIIIALLNSVIVERLVQRKKSSYAHRVNRAVFYVVILLGLAYYGSAFYGATHPPA
jgi:hypothetical protein